MGSFQYKRQTTGYFAYTAEGYGKANRVCLWLRLLLLHLSGWEEQHPAGSPRPVASAFALTFS